MLGLPHPHVDDYGCGSGPNLTNYGYFLTINCAAGALVNLQLQRKGRTSLFACAAKAAS